MHKAVFFDRDGVLINDAGHYYIYEKDDMRLNKGVIAALKTLTDMGYLLIIISNQGGIAKQIYTKEHVEKIHNEMKRQFECEGIHIKEFYYCPHHSDVEKCLCRKPEPLFIEQALARFNIDPNISYIIGDNERDIDAGQKAGLMCIKIKSNQNLLDVLSQIS